MSARVCIYRNRCSERMGLYGEIGHLILPFADLTGVSVRVVVVGVPRHFKFVISSVEVCSEDQKWLENVPFSATSHA